MCLVTGTVKIGTPSKEPEAGGWNPEGKRKSQEGGPEQGKGIREERGGPKGQGAGLEIREEKGRPKKGAGQDGNRAERGSPQERRKEF